MKQESPTLIQVEHDSYEAAFRAAAEEAATSMATIAPTVMYTQGNRSYLTTGFPLRYISERVRIDNLARGGDAHEHYNRPLLPEHHRTITAYLMSQEDYVLPPLSLCVQEALRCHVPKTASAVKLGVVVLPTSIVYNITDGQHRVQAIRNALLQKEKLGDDGIGVTIVIEDNMESIHQLFYDCAQTRPVPQSLLTAYNHRDMLARLVREAQNEIEVFRGRIEQVSKSVGKSSINLFTLNQLRIGVAEILTGDSSQATVSLRKDMEKMLASKEAVEEHLRFVTDYFNSFSLANQEWSELLGAGDPALGGIDTNLLRHRFVHCTGTGLTILGRMGYYIRNYPSHERERLIEALAKEVDWSRDAEIWQGSVVVSGRMSGQRAAVETAVMKLKNLLGIPLSPQEEKRALRRESK